MKRAKVSSVYEGRGRKRSKEGEEESEESSKSARMSAKARIDGLRARKAQSIISNNRTIVTRSMATKTMEKKDEEMLFEVEIIEAYNKEEEKNNDNKHVEVVQQPINEVVMENKGYDGGLLTLEDWPLTWSYEEEWSWFKVGYECGWYSYWETMHGDSWAPRDDNKKAVWNNDLWKFKDNFIPKP
ncbi:hypothetical protein CRYUN_Cryun14cG0167100 [Craigia yunnanensis]